MQTVPGGQLSEERDDDSDRQHRHDDEEPDANVRISVGEETERSAGIAHVGEVKETRDDLVTICVGQIVRDESLADEVSGETRDEGE